jgi:hypothetical protein
MERKCVLLGERLAGLDAEGIRGFRSHFDESDRRAYDWGLWGAAYVVCGGCSDDSFSDFRSTLISNGRSVFERVLADPDSLADTPLNEEEVCYEGYAYVVTDAEKTILGSVPSRSAPFPPEPSGVAWDEDDEEGLAERFPRLHSMHSSPPDLSGGDKNPTKPWWKIW